MVFGNMPKAEKTSEPVEQELNIDGIEPDIIEDDISTDGVVTTVESKPADEIADLRRQLEESNRRASDAEARATTLSQEKTVSEGRLATEVNGRFAAQEQAIEARAASAKSKLTSAKADLSRAFAEQRFEDAAELQAQISEATLEERTARWEKENLTAAKQRLTADIEAANSRPSDPQEAFLSNIPGEPSRKWLRDHPDVLKRVSGSQREAKALYGAAQMAEGKGHAPDSPEYFSFIEEQLGLKDPETVVTTTPTPKTQAQKAPGQTASAAPSNRSSNPSQSVRTVTIDDVVRKLSATDRANAKISFPDKTPDEAAKLYAHGLVLSKQREPGFRPDIRL